MPYRTLSPALIIETAEILDRRVEERFAASGISRVARELVSLSRDVAKGARDLEGPIWWLRALIAAAIVAGASMFAFVGTIVPLDRMSSDALESVQGFEALLNTLLLMGIGLFSLITLEERIKRKRVFRQLHGIRSLIHVIDMHQLTKDPAALSESFKRTRSSPDRSLGPAELTRYLDYCSEMLSITGKLAALYAQSVNDTVVLEAVNDIEELGSNLSRKIWQKIMLVDHSAHRPERRR